AEAEEFAAGDGRGVVHETHDTEFGSTNDTNLHEWEDAAQALRARRIRTPVCLRAQSCYSWTPPSAFPAPTRCGQRLRPPFSRGRRGRRIRGGGGLVRRRSWRVPGNCGLRP